MCAETDEEAQAKVAGWTFLRLPESLRQARHRCLGQGHMWQLYQAGMAAHEDICASLDLFADEVMPSSTGASPSSSGGRTTCCPAVSNSKTRARKDVRIKARQQ